MALNSHEYLELYHAAFLGGGVINPLNLRLAPKELEFIAQDSATRVCFVDRAFAPLVDRIKAQTSIEQVILIGDGTATSPTTSATTTCWRAPRRSCPARRRRTTSSS